MEDREAILKEIVDFMRENPLDKPLCYSVFEIKEVYYRDKLPNPITRKQLALSTLGNEECCQFKEVIKDNNRNKELVDFYYVLIRPHYGACYVIEDDDIYIGGYTHDGIIHFNDTVDDKVYATLEEAEDKFSKVIERLENI